MGTRVGGTSIHWGTSGDDCVGPCQSPLVCNHRSLTLADDGVTFPTPRPSVERPRQVTQAVAIIRMDADC